MLKAAQEDMQERFAAYEEEGLMCIESAYTGNPEEAEEFKKEIEAAFPGHEVRMVPLALSIACHIGHGALAIGCTKKVKI